MREKAARVLPEDGVPTAIAKILPMDNDMEKIQVQKAGTPVATPKDLNVVAQELDNSRPNGVVLERSGADESDLNAQRVAALTHMAERLQIEEQSNSDASMYQEGSMDNSMDKGNASKRIRTKHDSSEEEETKEDEVVI